MMRGLDVVLVVLLVGKAENALAGGDELQPGLQEVQAPGAVQAQWGSPGCEESDEAYGDSERKDSIIRDVDKAVCQFVDLSKAVAAKIEVYGEVYGEVSATLVGDDEDCNNTKTAVKLLPEIEWTLPSDQYYVLYELDGEQSDLEIAEHLWRDGFIPGVLQVALEKDVHLKFGCAEKDGQVLCMFEPPKDRLTKFKEEAEQRAEKLKNEFSMS